MIRKTMKIPAEWQRGQSLSLTACNAILSAEFKMATMQSGLRNTDGLLAHRRATSSPQTGYQPRDGLVAHRRATSKIYKNYDFFSLNILIISLLYRIKREHTFQIFLRLSFFNLKRSSPFVGWIVAHLWATSPSVGQQPVCVPYP